MNTVDIEKIIKIFENANITHLDLEIDNIKIKLEKNEVSKMKNNEITKVLDSESVSSKEVNGEVVTSPLVGTFYHAPSLDAKPFVMEGSKVSKGDKLCIIEAMKVMNEITAPCDGIVKKIFVENEKMVEYGQQLFLIGD